MGVSWGVGMNGVVPFTVECLWNQIHLSHLLVRDPSPCWIASFIEAALHPQPRLGLRCTDQLHDHLMSHQRLTAPVLGNKAEEAMLNFIPFARSWREMAYLDGQPQFVHQLLQLHFPQPEPVAVAAPPSAVINNDDAAGYKVRPISFHQVRIVSTANAPVS